MSEPLKRGHQPSQLSPEARSTGYVPPARTKVFRPDPVPSWRPKQSFWIGVIAIAAIALVALFGYVHYNFDQAPHRLWKVMFGIVVATFFVLRPGITVYALPLAFAYKEWLPVTPIPLLNAMNLLTYVLLATWVANAAFQKRPMFESNPINTPLGLFLGWLTLSWIHGELLGGYGVSPFRSFQAFWNNMTGMVLFFPLLFNIRTMEQVKRLALWFCVATGAGVISLLMESAEYGGNHRVAGAIEDLNIAGAFFAMSGLFALGMVTAKGTPLWGRIGTIGATVASGTSVLLTGSRGALLALAAGSVPQGIRSGVVGMVTVAVLALGLSLGAPDMVKHRVTDTFKAFTGEEDASSTQEYDAVNQTSGGRLEIWRAVLEIVAQKPLMGVGLYRLAESVEESIHRYKVAHNLYLELLGESGVPCLLIFIFWMHRCFRTGRQLARAPGFSSGLGSAYLYALIGLLITNIFGQRLVHFSMSGAHAYLTALVVRAHQLEGEAARQRRAAAADTSQVA